MGTKAEMLETVIGFTVQKILERVFKLWKQNKFIRENKSLIKRKRRLEYRIEIYFKKHKKLKYN